MKKLFIMHQLTLTDTNINNSKSEINYQYNIRDNNYKFNPLNNIRKIKNNIQNENDDDIDCILEE